MALGRQDHRAVSELLDKFFCWKSTLREYLDSVLLINGSDERSREALFCGVPKELESLLDGTFICCGCDVDVIPCDIKLFDTHCDHSKLVDQVIEDNCRKGKEYNNVLSRGFSANYMRGFRVWIKYPNTTTFYMRSKVWQDLCSRIGSELMLHILQNMSMFRKAKRGNLIQITGTVVDRSNAKDGNHSCSGQFHGFVQHLSLLNGNAVISTSAVHQDASPPRPEMPGEPLECSYDTFQSIAAVECFGESLGRDTSSSPQMSCSPTRKLSKGSSFSAKRRYDPELGTQPLCKSKRLKEDHAPAKIPISECVNPPLDFGIGSSCTVAQETLRQNINSETKKDSHFEMSCSPPRKPSKRSSSSKLGTQPPCQMERLMEDLVPAKIPLSECVNPPLDLGIVSSCTVAQKTVKENIHSIKAKKDCPKTSFNKKHVLGTRRIMYSKSLRERLNKSHILNKVNPSNKGAEALAFHIFCRQPVGAENCASHANKAKPLSNENCHTVTKLPNNLRRSLPVLRQLIQEYKKVKVHRHLLRHCIYSEEVKNLLMSYNLEKKTIVHYPSLKFDAEKQRALYDAALKDNIPPYRVFVFVKSICSKILPASLLESESNWRVFYKNLKQFFTLGQHEFITLPMIMKGIKYSHCTWTYKSRERPKYVPRSFSTWQRKVVESLILWVVADFIMPLLRNCFYVTDSGLHRKKLLYFRSMSWAAMLSLARDTCLRKNFTEVGRNVVMKAITRGESFGCEKMRVIPKVNKFRPIILRSSDKSFNGNNSTKYDLERLHHVLKFLAEDKPYLHGTAVSDNDEIRSKLKRFQRLIAEKEGERPNLYFVASDIECCFDSIPHGKMIEVTKNAVGNADFTIRKFSVTSFVMSKTCLTETKRVAGRDAKDTFVVFIEKYLCSKDCRVSDSIITDGVFYQNVTNARLCGALSKLLRQSYVEFGSRLYRISKGIAQGSIVSCNLCNLLYGHMENTHLDEFIRSDSCLIMRWTDDFLLITTSQRLAEKFLIKLKAGFPEYGCSINIGKSKTNLPTHATCPTSDIQRVIESWFPWCNLLINTNTLNVRLSYTRYQGKSIGDSLTLRLGSRPGRTLLTRMMQYIRIQTSSIIMDPELNSRQNILTNAYQVFYFIATKFSHYVSKLPIDGQPNAKPGFFRLVLHNLFRGFYGQYRKVHEKICSNRVALVSKADMKSLFYSAMFSVFKLRKKSYTELIKHIRPRVIRSQRCNIKISLIKKECAAVFNKIH